MNTFAFKFSFRLFKNIRLILCLFLSVLLVACFSKSNKYFGNIESSSRQYLVIANHSEPRSLDPHKSSSTAEGNVIKELFEGLTVYDPHTLEPLPAGAISWDIQDAARVWIFHLRKESVWTNGQAVVAADYIYSWQRAVSPKTASPYSALMFCIKNAEAINNGEQPPDNLGVKALDEFTLRIEMEYPVAFFAQITSHFIFAPVPRWVIEQYENKWTEVNHVVSNGPFVLTKHSPNDEIVIKRNSKYWDVNNVKLPEVHFWPVLDSMAMNLYKSGDLDVMTSGLIPLPFTQVLKNKQDYCNGVFFCTYYYSINIKKAPLDNKLVRQALNLAIDKSEIADKLLGRGELSATLLIPPGIPRYDQLEGPKYDAEKARNLLAKAGYPGGHGFPRLTLYYNSQGAHKQIAEAIQQMWKKNLGITIELQSEEWQTFQARIEKRDFDICRDVWQGDYLDPTTFLDIFKTLNANNHAGWINTFYTELLNQANVQLDSKERLRILAQAENYLIDEAPIIPIYFYANSYLKKPYVDGYYVNLLDTHQLKYVSMVSK